MYPHDNDDDSADFESALKSLRPRAPSADFADRAAVESRLRSLTPAAPPEGFADRVVAASVSAPAARLVRFPGALVPLAAAAALALVFAPGLFREPPAAPAVAPAPAALVAEVAPEFPEEALHLPVINLPDGRAYRPVLRRQAVSPADFRVMPGGAVMPVSFAPSAGVDYEPVVFE